MSQQQATGSTKATEAPKSTISLCKTFTEQQASMYIDPFWIQMQLMSAGIQYTPTSPYVSQARMMIIEDIKNYLAMYFKHNGVDISEDPETIKRINTWFETALIKTNPMLASQSGLIAQERLQELMSTGIFGMMGGMGGFGGMQMGAMGMGGMNPMMMGGMGGMNPMMGGFGGMQMGGGSLWNAKKTEAKPGQQAQNQGFNPMMGGMGMNPMMMMGGMNPMMGMGGMNPMMNMGGFGGFGGLGGGI